MPYIMQIFYFNIHNNQAEFTKNNGHISPIVYRIYCRAIMTKGHVILIFALYTGKNAKK